MGGIVSFLTSVKKWVVTTIFLLLLSFRLFAYPLLKDTANFGTIQIISYNAIQNNNYTILEEGNGYWIIEINGEILYVDKPSS